MLVVLALVPAGAFVQEEKAPAREKATIARENVAIAQAVAKVGEQRSRRGYGVVFASPLVSGTGYQDMLHVGGGAAII